VSVKDWTAEKMVSFFRGCANGLRFGTRTEIHVGPVQHHADHFAFPMVVGAKGFLVTAGEFDPEEILREAQDEADGIRRDVIKPTPSKDVHVAMGVAHPGHVVLSIQDSPTRSSTYVFEMQTARDLMNNLEDLIREADRDA